MSALSDLRFRMRALFQRQAMEEELDDELRFHFENEVDKYRRAGLPEDEARRQARLAFGGQSQVAEDCRQAHGVGLLGSMLQDIRYELRQMKKSPGFALAVVLTLALGIGANTAIFQLTYAILLKSLPVPTPGELIRYTFDKGDTEILLSYAQYTALERYQGVASGLFAWTEYPGGATLRRNGQAEKIPIALASGSMFRVLELQPTLGRWFSAQAGEPGSPYQPETVLSYDFWRTAFKSDPSIVGKTLNLENSSLTIVGVLPKGFDGLDTRSEADPSWRAEVVVPLGFDRILQPKGAMIDMPGGFWLLLMGRLKPGETLQQARANLAAIRNTVNQTVDPNHTFLFHGFFAGFELGVVSGRGGFSLLRTQYSKPLVALEALCGLMMLLCGVNVALLVLSRVSGRMHEFAMRLALGAPRGRLLTQVLIETLLLGVGGLSLGGLMGCYLAKLLAGMLMDPEYQPLLHLQASAAIFLFAAAIGIGAALIGGLWPAWRASRTAPAGDLKRMGLERKAVRLGRWIIPTQVALGVVLLYCALLLVGTLTTYLREHAGFQTNNVVMAQVDIKAAGVLDDQRRTKVLDFLDEVQSAPGVRSAAVMSMAPLSHFFDASDFYARDSGGHLRVNKQIWSEDVTANYFKTMGTGIVEGRGFAVSDDQGERTCILSASAARYSFPGESAVGQYLNAGDGTEKTADRAVYRVVGVAEDARFASLQKPAPTMAYFPMESTTTPVKFAYTTHTTLAVRAADPALGMDAIRQSWTRVFPNTVLPRNWTFEQAVNSDLNKQRLLSGMSSGFALLALALVATGLYGILARAVMERRREIGIRMALGAARGKIVAELARDAAIRVGLGVVVGAVLAGIGGRMLHGLLYGVTSGSPIMVAATLALLLFVVALAFVVPAERAASVNPMESIRQE